MGGRQYFAHSCNLYPPLLRDLLDTFSYKRIGDNLRAQKTCPLIELFRDRGGFLQFRLLETIKLFLPALHVSFGFIGGNSARYGGLYYASAGKQIDIVAQYLGKAVWGQFGAVSGVVVYLEFQCVSVPFDDGLQ